MTERVERDGVPFDVDTTPAAAGPPWHWPPEAAPCPHFDAAGQPISCSEAEAARPDPDCAFCGDSNTRVLNKDGSKWHCGACGKTFDIRRALLRSDFGNRREAEEVLPKIQRALPWNYRARTESHMKWEIVIEGTDDHGWTLDDYVIPRLATCLYSVYEVPFQ